MEDILSKHGGKTWRYNTNHDGNITNDLIYIYIHIHIYIYIYYIYVCGCAKKVYRQTGNVHRETDDTQVD